MDKTKAKNLADGTLLVLLVLAFLLYSQDIINEMVYIICELVIIGVYALISHLMNKNAAGSNIDKIERAFRKQKVERTREGMLFEVATALILVSLVIMLATRTYEQAG